MKKILFIILSMALFASCERKIDEYPASANGVDYSNFVAVGNSLTAGLADGALYLSAQQNSIPAIMAKQLTTVGGGDFRQPLIGTENGVGFQQIPGGLYYYTKMILKVVPDKDCAGNPVGTASIKPGFAVVNPDQTQMQQQLFAPPLTAGPYNNMGVPGLSLQAAFLPGYGNYNPFFKRFETSATASVITDAIRQQPTFFMLWLGDNDALVSAMAGTDAFLTPADTFAKYYPMAVGALMASGKSPKGVLVNIPDVTSIPFFTTISKQLPYNSVICDETQAAQLNFVYSAWGHPEIVWKAGPNPFVYTKTDGSYAQMGPNDLFLLTLPTDSIKCRLMGTVDTTVHPLPKPYPIPGKYVLDKAEQDNIRASIAGFNEVISQTAANRSLALADMNTYMSTFASGMIFDGVKVSLTFVTGGLFSTDGIHLCPRGSVVAANYILDAIERKYGSKIPKANFTEYPGLVFP